MLVVPLEYGEEGIDVAGSAIIQHGSCEVFDRGDPLLNKVRMRISDAFAVAFSYETATLANLRPTRMLRSAS